MKKFVVRDPIHREISLDDCHKKAMSHQLFQRLRRISQNGLLSYIFPGMRHSRFEHSLGAAHLAGKLFDQITIEDYKNIDDTHCPNGPILEFNKTRSVVSSMKKGDEWKNIFVMAALLHDVGHGPLSHTFEEMKLLKLIDLREVKQVRVHPYFVWLAQKEKEIEHEDVSLAYAAEILHSIGWAENIQLVGYLINKRYREFSLQDGKLMSRLDGSLDTLRLLAPYISGFFDVDRLDYLERDSTMAGVSYGLVETDRILSSVRTVLATSGDTKRKPEVAIVVRAKRFHMLDHFLVCLYEMYTQLYNHPTNIQIQHEIKSLVKVLEPKISTHVNLEWHKSASDELFFSLLREYDDGLLDKILLREFKKKNSEPIVMQMYSKSSKVYKARIDDNWTPLPAHKRQILKDGSQVWLIDQAVGGDQPEIFGWTSDSLVASKLSGATYEPLILWRNKDFTDALADLQAKISGLNKKRIRGGKH